MSHSAPRGTLEPGLQSRDPSKAVNFLRDEFSFNSYRLGREKCFILFHSGVVTFTKRDGKTFEGILNVQNFMCSFCNLGFFLPWLQIQSREGPTRRLPLANVWMWGEPLWEVEDPGE